MGALTSLTKSVPEDDLLLKNAVEAGASLESLAKGAVHFSRRYTLCELQDRWRSLLYDLDTSTEASARIVEIEIELAASNLPKVNRACISNCKEKELTSGKRKTESVQSQYYAMRKRIRSEPSSADLRILMPPVLLAGTERDNGYRDQLKPQSKHPINNFALEVPFSNDHVHQETCYDNGQHAFPEIPDGRSHGGCLFGYTENISSSPLGEANYNNGNRCFEHNFQQKDFPHILGGNLISVDTSLDVHEVGQSNAFFGSSSPYKNDDIGAKPPSDFDSSDNNGEGLCADFAGNDNLSSHVPDCSGSFHQLGYSSPLSDMPIWRTMDDLSTPTMPMDGHYRDNGKGLLNMDDHKKINAAECDVASSEPKLDDRMCGAGLNNPTIMSENDFMDFSDTYMDFADDEGLLFVDVNEKDNTERSGLGLSSILLNSPSDTHHGVDNSNDFGTTNVAETCIGIPDAASSVGPDVLIDQMHSGTHNDHNSSVSAVNVPSASSQTSDTTEPQQEFMICVLNTEDPDIPNNDHVIFHERVNPPFSSSNQEGCTSERTRVASLAYISPTVVGDLSKAKEHAAVAQPMVSSIKANSLFLPKLGMLNSCDGVDVPAESSIAGVSSYAASSADEPKPCKSGTVALNTTQGDAFKEEDTALSFQNQENPDASFASFLENHLQEADDAKLNPLNATDSCREEANKQVVHPDLVSAAITFTDTAASDQEEQFSDSEDDVPYFSDIEAMVLDMDLSQYDEESCLFPKEVSRYHHMDAKKTIRWEQGLHSHINRSISSHGAFAVFYGRHLKYFIKEPEVSIGRETKDTKVDIDLAREGRANKISRRQAIIKIDEEGEFSLKNIGRCSLFVNGKEVPAKKRKLYPHVFWLSVNYWSKLEFLRMGALTALTKWALEDDLLLKNAVEAGASLESLAKGAVHFSRRYTLRELQDRWRSLLFDLDTSTEASSRIVEIEIELAASNLPKVNRACNSNCKEKESTSGKRKTESVQSQYYAMRKRIRSQPSSADLRILMPPVLLAGTERDNAYRDQLKPQSKHPINNFAHEVPFSNDYAHQETGYDNGQHAFPEIPNGRSPGGCLFGYTENISSSPLGDANYNNGNRCFEHNFQQRDFPHILGENLISVDTSLDVHEVSQSNAFGTSSPYKIDDIGAKPPSDFDSSDNNGEGLCADFAGNDNLSSHVPDCSGSFHQLGYSSPLSDMQIWRTMDDLSTPTMPMDGHYRDKGKGLLNMDDHKKINAAECDVASSEPKLDDRMCGAGLNNPTIMSEKDFMDFSNTYMDFADDEGLLFVDVNEKYNTDRSGLGLSSILLNSPSDTHHGVDNSNDFGTTNVAETCIGIPDAASSGGPDVLIDQMHSGTHNDHNSSVSAINVPSASSQTSDTTEPQQEFMICVLNTEDPDIPNNDHVIFHERVNPPFSSSNREGCASESTRAASLANILPTDVGDLSKAKEHAAVAQPMVSSMKANSLFLPKLGMLNSCDGVDVRAESSIAGVCSYAASGADEPKPCNSGTVALNTTQGEAFKEEDTALSFQNQENPDASFASFLENHLQEADDAKLNPLNATDSCREEANKQAVHPDLVSAAITFADTVASDQEEQFSDSEDNVPYFSDIEAMILDMDLSQYDDESCLFPKEVSRYHHMDAKKTIRWEQGLHSHINRSISSHGAFAVFCGRHLKYFIKEPEVSIGRETKDTKVDIDLAREGRANKISRRQAIIKIDEEGEFSLKNIGRCSLFVNGKEVPAKRRTTLPSHSLVKIQDMHFTFDVNESAVRRFLKRKSSQEQSTFRFDWKPDQNP